MRPKITRNCTISWINTSKYSMTTIKRKWVLLNQIPENLRLNNLQYCINDRIPHQKISLIKGFLKTAIWSVIRIQLFLTMIYRTMLSSSINRHKDKQGKMYLSILKRLSYHSYQVVDISALVHKWVQLVQN